MDTGRVVCFTVNDSSFWVYAAAASFFALVGASYISPKTVTPLPLWFFYAGWALGFIALAMSAYRASGYLGSSASHSSWSSSILNALFFLSLLLNLLWSYIFFCGDKSSALPLIAVTIVILVWYGRIVADVDPLASVLLVAYILWLLVVFFSTTSAAQEIPLWDDPW